MGLAPAGAEILILQCFWRGGRKSVVIQVTGHEPETTLGRSQLNEILGRSQLDEILPIRSNESARSAYNWNQVTLK